MEKNIPKVSAKSAEKSKRRTPSLRSCLNKALAMGINPVSTYSVNATLYDYSSGKATAMGSKKTDSGLSEEDKEKVKELAARDRDVRAHEAAHEAVGGQYVKGGATFTYQKGPDGKMYAVGGEVSIDTAPVKGDPQATISKMETVKRAALAPADPSGQDRAVAASASAEEADARQELAKKSVAGGKGNEKAAIAPTRATTYPQTRSYNAQGFAVGLAGFDTGSLLGIA